MKLSKNKTVKTVAIALSVCLVCSLTGGVAFSAGSGNTYENALKAAQDGKAAAETALATLKGTSTSDSTEATAAAATETVAGKDETVYVMTDSQGAVQKIVVSDQLKNPQGEANITDKSSLNDITNLKSDGNFTKNSDGTITWNAQGKDIYYQGTTEKTLPIQVSVSYTLDGKSISPSDLAGKSGKVVIRYDYKEDVGSTGNTTVPFVAMTGMILKNDSFKNVTVSNGKIIDDGDKRIIVGFAFPGLQDGLKLSTGTADIPDYVEVTADAENFAIDSTLTYATCDFAQDIDTSKISNADDLTSALSQVTSAVTQLTDGSSALYDGLSTLLEKSNEMTAGIATLSNGASQLSTGLTTLDSNSAKLKSGAYQVFTTLTATAQTQLNAALTANGLAAVTLTPETYSTVLGGLLDKFSSGAYSQAKTAAEAQVRTAVQAAVLAQVTDGVKAAVKAAVIAKGYTAAQADAYVASTGASTVSANVATKMASDEIKKTIETNVATQLASADVQAKITAAVDSGLSGNASYSAIKSLKTSLDSYASFYAGLSTYTAGVSSAASGAAQVAGGLGQLKTGSATLVSGVTQLRDGAMQLSDGVKEFSGKLNSKLGSLSTSDLTNIIPRISTMLNAAKSYKNFSGIADNVTGSVKFIYKTASIGE